MTKRKGRPRKFRSRHLGEAVEKIEPTPETLAKAQKGETMMPHDYMHRIGLLTDDEAQTANEFRRRCEAVRATGKPSQGAYQDVFVKDAGEEPDEARQRARYNEFLNVLGNAGTRAKTATVNAIQYGRWPLYLKDHRNGAISRAGADRVVNDLRDGIQALNEHYKRGERVMEAA